jgi:hypothetical protein
VALVVLQTGYRCRVCRVGYLKRIEEIRREADLSWQLENLKVAAASSFRPVVF